MVGIDLCVNQALGARYAVRNFQVCNGAFEVGKARFPLRYTSDTLLGPIDLLLFEVPYFL